MWAGIAKFKHRERASHEVGEAWLQNKQKQDENKIDLFEPMYQTKKNTTHRKINQECSLAMSIYPSTDFQ